MGYKDKEKYHKDLHQQAYDRLTKMQAYGESKKDAIEAGTSRDKIFSYDTYKTYWQHAKAFIKYVDHEHSGCTNLKQARQYVNEWLIKNETEGKKPHTLHTQAAALRKLFSITPSDKDYYKPPERRRENITRSRLSREHDKHFSKTNNAELIRFCKGVGARREGMSKIKGKDLRTKDQIRQEVDRLTKIEKMRELTRDEQKDLKINREALLFSKNDWFLHMKEKGGRERISPIVGPDVDEIIARIKNTPPEERVWLHIHQGADIHSFRSQYSNIVYRMYCRSIDEIPYDRINKGTGRRYQSEVYHCRRDEAGRSLDKKAMQLASIALGHNRIEVVANNYLRGL